VSTSRASKLCRCNACQAPRLSIMCACSSLASPHTLCVPRGYWSQELTICCGLEGLISEDNGTDVAKHSGMPMVSESVARHQRRCYFVRRARTITPPLRIQDFTAPHYSESRSTICLFEGGKHTTLSWAQMHHSNARYLSCFPGLAFHVASSNAHFQTGMPTIRHSVALRQNSSYPLVLVPPLISSPPLLAVPFTMKFVLVFVLFEQSGLVYATCGETMGQT